MRKSFKCIDCGLKLDIDTVEYPFTITCACGVPMLPVKPLELLDSDIEFLERE